MNMLEHFQIGRSCRNGFCTSPGNLIASTISQEQRVSPDAYHPNTELVTYCAGVPRPLQLGLELNINEC